jgi:hypothetical protein
MTKTATRVFYQILPFLTINHENYVEPVSKALDFETIQTRTHLKRVVQGSWQGGGPRKSRCFEHTG